MQQGRKPPGYPYGPGIHPYSLPYPFQYGKPPFTRNPDWVWKLLIFSALLGVVTSLLLFISINSYMNGDIDEMGLEGQILDTREDPITNATIRIIDLNLTQQTDSNGKYEFKDVESGTHTLQIQANGYRTMYYKFTMFSDNFFSPEIVEKDSELKPREDRKSTTENIDESLGNSLYFIPTMVMVASTVCFLGRLLARKRHYWTLYVISSVVGILSLGFFFISPILCILATFILLRPRNPFNGKKK